MDLIPVVLVFSLLVLPQTVTLDNKPNYDKGRGIWLLSLVDTTNIYFTGEQTLTVPQSVGQQSLTVRKVRDSKVNLTVCRHSNRNTTYVAPGALTSSPALHSCAGVRLVVCVGGMTTGEEHRRRRSLQGGQARGSGAM